MLKATIITTIVGLVSARTMSIWNTLPILGVVASLAVAHLGIRYHFSLAHELAALGVLGTVGQFSYIAGVLLLL